MTELERLAAVRRYDILDTPPDGAFDRITAIAARLLKVPIAVISIVDHDRIWFKSRRGIDVHQVDRDLGLCASCILQENAWVVGDARTDVRALVKRAEIESDMAAAREYLNCAEEPNGGCECHYSGRSRHCGTFAYSHPGIPDYSVHDIVRIGNSKKKLTYFVNNNIFTLDEVPDDDSRGWALHEKQG